VGSGALSVIEAQVSQERRWRFHADICSPFRITQLWNNERLSALFCERGSGSVMVT
jgi:hypothetical protein